MAGTREFSAGEVVTQSLRTLGRNILPFSVTVLLVLAPVFVFQLAVEPTFGPPTDDQLLLSAGLALLLVFLAPVATGALCYGVFQDVRRRRVGVGDCLSVGLRRLFPVLGVTIIVGVATVVGFFACCFPGFLVATIFGVSIPAAVVERPGLVGALERSQELTKGYRWQVFAILAALYVLSTGLNMAVSLPEILLLPVPHVVMVVVGAIASVFTTALQATTLTVLYYHLRSAKETFDIEEIAAVFD